MAVEHEIAGERNGHPFAVREARGAVTCLSQARSLRVLRGMADACVKGVLADGLQEGFLRGQRHMQMDAVVAPLRGELAVGVSDNQSANGFALVCRW